MYRKCGVWADRLAGVTEIVGSDFVEKAWSVDLVAFTARVFAQGAQFEIFSHRKRIVSLKSD